MSNKAPLSSALITVKLIEDMKSGGKKVWTTKGDTYLINAKNVAKWPDIEVGDNIEVMFAVTESVWQGSPQITKWINMLKPAQDAPNPVPPVKAIPPATQPLKHPVPAESKPSGNGSKYTESDLKAFERKDRMMARECAYKCAAQDVTAYVEAGVSAKQFDGMSLDRIGDLLSARRNAVYIEVLQGITGEKLETEETPF